MLYGKEEIGNYMDSLWSDLPVPTKEAIIEFLGEKSNYDGVPFTGTYCGSEEFVYA